MLVERIEFCFVQNSSTLSSALSIQFILFIEIDSLYMMQVCIYIDNGE